jgi:hypothetical protein
MKLRRSRLVTAVLALTAWVGLASSGRAQPASLSVVVMLQNDAGVPAHDVARAQAEVVRLYRLIDVDVDWVSRVPQNCDRLLVVSLVPWEPAEKTLSASVLGLTYVTPEGSRNRVDVFVQRVERAGRDFTTSISTLLAVVMAHELGHTLMPNGSHSKTGLMTASLDASHFRLASVGLLHFSPESAAVIRRELIEEIGIAAMRMPRKKARLSPASWPISRGCRRTSSRFRETRCPPPPACSPSSAAELSLRRSREPRHKPNREHAVVGAWQPMKPTSRPSVLSGLSMRCARTHRGDPAICVALV